MNPNASTTNREKSKTKNFMMVKHKVKRNKGKRSFHDKQVNNRGSGQHAAKFVGPNLSNFEAMMQNCIFM